MCGIFGIFSHEKVKFNDSLKSFGKQNSKRGPDGYGFVHLENMFMGMYRLAIVGNENGGQPIFSEDKNVAIICNGEIYNYKELKNELSRDIKFTSTSDVEVILKGYLLHGIDFFSRLSGMFALAIFDKEKNELIISRDRFGIKPLFIMESKKSLYFSSTITSFQSLQCKISDKNVIKQIIQGYSIGKNTLLSDVQMLPQGEVHSYKLIEEKISKKIKCKYSLAVLLP